MGKIITFEFECSFLFDPRIGILYIYQLYHYYLSIIYFYTNRETNLNPVSSTTASSYLVHRQGLKKGCPLSHANLHK